MRVAGKLNGPQYWHNGNPYGAKSEHVSAVISDVPQRVSNSALMCFFPINATACRANNKLNLLVIFRRTAQPNRGESGRLETLQKSAMGIAARNHT